MQNKEANNLTAAEWDEFNQWFGNTAKAGAQTISTPINVLLNTTSDIGVNVLENVGKLGETGMTSVINIAWGIATASFILFIPLALIASYKSGLVTTVFKKISRSIEGNPQSPLPPPVNPQNLAPTPIIPNPIMPNPTPLRRLSQTPTRSREDVNKRLGLTGPPRSSTPLRRRGGKKTHKNKKGLTRKLKRGKRRQTRRQTGRKTKRR